jgi:hypothetical protein
MQSMYIFFPICTSSHTRLDCDANSAARQHSIAVLRLSKLDYIQREEDRKTTITPKEICKHDDSFKYKSTHWRNFANNTGKGGGGGVQNRPFVLGKNMPLFRVPYNARVSFFLSLHHPINTFENFSISCFSTLQLNTQIKPFLGAKHNGGAIVSLAPLS